MKKMLFLLVMVAALVVPTHVNAVHAAPVVNPVSNGTEPLEVRLMLSRLEAIDDIDKSTLTSSERKALRKEVRILKKELKANNGGVYLSVGALLLVIILLIVLL